MKFLGAIVTLSAFCSVSAFFVPAPKANGVSSLNAYYADTMYNDVRRGGRSGYSSRDREYGGGYGGRNGYGYNGGYGGSYPEVIQGESLKTFPNLSPFVDQVQISLQTDGGPLKANLDFWDGPDRTAFNMSCFSQDGRYYPVNAIIPTRGNADSGTVAVRNTGEITFPLVASVMENAGPQIGSMRGFDEKLIQGGAVDTISLEQGLGSVQVMIETDGRPLSARIELLEGPNNSKQIYDVETEDGYEFPFFAILDTPGKSHTIRIKNTGPMEFPIIASVEGYGRDYGMSGGYSGSRGGYGGWNGVERRSGDSYSGSRSYGSYNRGREGYGRGDYGGYGGYGGMSRGGYGGMRGGYGGMDGMRSRGGYGGGYSSGYRYGGYDGWDSSSRRRY